MTALCIVPSTAQLVASCDSGGSCHIWSARTGSLVHRLCEPRPGQLAQQPRPASARKLSTCGKTWHLKCSCACLKMSITGPFLKHLCNWLEKSIAEEQVILGGTILVCTRPEDIMQSCRVGKLWCGSKRRRGKWKRNSQARLGGRCGRIPGSRNQCRVGRRISAKAAGTDRLHLRGSCGARRCGCDRGRHGGRPSALARPGVRSAER